MKNSSALMIENLSKSYSGTVVVDDFNLAIPAGEIFGLLGPNGAGKSTTINLVSGVARMEGGRIRVFDHDNQRDYPITRRLVGDPELKSIARK